MNLWIIEPRDPVIFRDGRPFNATPGARATSLPFPYPSVTAGAVRTRLGWDSRNGFDSQRIPKLLSKTVRGPLLVEYDQKDDAIRAWYFPAPADSLLLKVPSDRGRARRVWLRPVQLPAGVHADMPDGLLPVSTNPAVNEKPYSNPPRFWRWEQMAVWLAQPAMEPETIVPTDLGLEALPVEERIHVSIDVSTKTAEEGRLFQTSALSFVKVDGFGENGRPELSRTRFFSLAVETDADLTPGPDFLGGERRIVGWKNSSSSFPACPKEITTAIDNSGFCRLVLATPAHFNEGYLPTWIQAAIPGLNITVLAAVVPKAQVVSGWDFARKQPKPSRRLAPAGSVYFLKLEGSEDARRQFVANIWLRAISDNAQDRRDGFGLALLGAWDGRVEKLEVKHA